MSIDLKLATAGIFFEAAAASALAETDAELVAFRITTSAIGHGDLMSSGKPLALAFWSTLLVLTSGCASMASREPVEAYVVGVEPLQGAGLELRMLIKLRVQNPNDTPIDYSGVSVSMSVQGKRFATGVSDAAGTVPRFGESVIDVPVSISAIRLVGRAMEVFGNEHTGKIEYELRGKLAGPAFNSVRFNSKGEMELPKSSSAGGSEARK